MKKIFTYQLAALLMAFTMGITSCSGFLDMTPRNKKVVKTVEDHRDILASYMYFIKSFNRSQIKIMGVSEYAFPEFNVGQTLSIYTGESSLANFAQFYDNQTRKFKKDGVVRLTWLDSNNSIWNRYYSFLGPINMLLKDIETAECDDVSIKNYVKGEALAWRAYAYFKLLQYYSPYNNSEVGIPIYLDPSDDVGNAMPARKTQRECFSRIIKDCQEVLGLLKETPTNEWNYIYREDFVHAMLASIYTWKAGSASAENDDWSNAEKNAIAAIGSRKLVSDVNQFKRIFDCSKAGISNELTSPEFFIRIVDNSRLILNSDAYRMNYAGTSISTGMANPDYVKMYADNDKRKSFYFYNDKDGVTRNDKYNISEYDLGLDSPGCYMPFRLAEMFLIKAEAECRTNKIADAMATLNSFRAARYNQPGSFNGDAEAVLNEILKERSREFLLENDFIWLDMKRLGKTLTREVNGIQEILEPDDFRYTFPVPQREMKENKNIMQAPGWENYYQ